MAIVAQPQAADDDQPRRVGSTDPFSHPPLAPATPTAVLPRTDEAPAALGGAGALSCSVAVGVALGWSCEAMAAGGSSWFERAGSVVAERAFPWVIAAFVVGSLGALIVRVGRPARSVPATGAVCGAVCLVVATIVYYGPARSALPVEWFPLRRTVGWTVISLAIGTVFGALGAVWTRWRDSLIATLAVVALTATVAGEAVLAVASGAYGPDAPARAVMVATAAAALLAAIMLSPRHRKAVALAAVGLLACPAAIAVGLVLTRTGNL